ncbi:hypothetical protein DH2020_017277 [Rehmannia glutinosa]|uniref:starch synthase n=1 Tax=Rehmannia glutinosa TaxID=99300 RepID=A0ABR0WQM1_REHGL
MEVPLPLQRSLSSSRVLSERTRFKIKLSMPHGTTQSFYWKMDPVAASVTYRITASADFSRRRPRKISTPRSKDSTPRGFMPRTQVPTSTQRRDQKNEEKEGPGTSPPDEFEGSNIETSELNIEYDKEEVSDINLVAVEEERDNESNGIDLEVASISKSLFDNKISQFDDNGRIPEVDEHTMESKDAERFTKSEDKVTTGDVDVSIYGRGIEEKQIHTKSGEDQWREKIEKEELVEEMVIFKAGKDASDESDSRIDETETISKTVEQVESTKNVVDSYKHLAVKPEAVDTGYNSISEDTKKEDNFLKLKLESEEILRKEAVDRLAEDNFKKGNKLFYYPELVKPDQDIEIYFNRSFSTLKNEPDVMIMGAYNGWKWKSFTLKLSKSHLNGDWWSCQVHVPKEAYKIDFVFYNGKDVYENNDKQDFCITVEGGMDVFDFENFLLEEKRREQEEFARQKAERERQAEEQRRIEAEIAANEADRVQAREEAAKRRKIVQEIMKKAVSSVDNVWYIEPTAFEGNDMVRLYYNRSSGPLSHANDIWIHGGHNGWSDGLSIVSKLIKSEEKYGDWWYADVVVPDRALVLDWVFADGPPQQAIIYDNNNLQDFHAIVPTSIPEELYWVKEEQQTYKRLNTERRLREEAIRAKVPLDAYMMDFVFSEREDGGIFDNKNGMDYHIPVFGGVVKEPPMHIVHIAVEMAPIAKVGGLGDVVTSLSRAVQDMNHNVDIILPKYDCLNLSNDIIHCHDWSSAPVAWLFKEHYVHYGLSKARVVFTIHNLEFGAALIGKAMAFSDKATTVSPTYSQEVSGNPAVAPHLYKFHGILNGIDPDIWDPYNDKFIPVPYTSENVVEGKTAAKEALQQKLGLKRADLPLVGIITRLTHQKGIHLIKHAIWRTLERNGQIYAGADFILVPSIFEPCGLTQLTAMRYGSIPVVRKTGGE